MSSAGTVARFVVIFLAALVAQVSVAANISLFGYVVDLVLMVVVVSSLLVAAEEGAMLGFFGGLCSDLIAQTPFGMWTFSMTLIGFAAGSVSKAVFEGGRPLRAVVAGFLAISAVAAFVALGGLIGQEFVTSRPLLPIALTVGLSTIALSPLVERVARWGLIMRPTPGFTQA